MSNTMLRNESLNQITEEKSQLNQVRLQLESVFDSKVNLDLTGSEAQQSLENSLTAMVNTRGGDVKLLEDQYRQRTEPKNVLTKISSLGRKMNLPGAIQDTWFGLGQTAARALNKGMESLSESKVLAGAAEFVKDNLTYDPVSVLKDITSDIYVDFAKYNDEQSIRSAIYKRIFELMGGNSIQNKNLVTGKAAAVLNTLVTIGNYNSNTGEALQDIKQTMKSNLGVAPKFAAIVDSLTKRIISSREVAVARLSKNQTLEDKLIDRASNLTAANKGDTFGAKSDLSVEGLIATFGVGTVSMLNGLVVSAAGEKLSSNYEYSQIYDQELKIMRVKLYKNSTIEKLIAEGKLQPQQVELLVTAAATKSATQKWLRISELRLSKNEAYSKAEQDRKGKKLGFIKGVLNSVIGRQQWEILQGNKITSESELIGMIVAAKKQQEQLQMVAKEKGVSQFYDKIMKQLDSREMTDEQIAVLDKKLVKQKTKVGLKEVALLGAATVKMAQSIAIRYVSFRPGIALLGEGMSYVSGGRFHIGGQTFDGTFSPDLAKGYAAGVYYQDGLTGVESAQNAAIGMSLRMTAGVAPMLMAGQAGFQLASHGGEVIHGIENSTARVISSIEQNNAYITAASFVNDRLAMGNHVFETTNAAGQHELILNVTNPNDYSDALQQIQAIAKPGDVLVVRSKGLEISRNTLVGNQGVINTEAIDKNILQPANLKHFASLGESGAAFAAEIPVDASAEVKPEEKPEFPAQDISNKPERLAPSSEPISEPTPPPQNIEQPAVAEPAPAPVDQHSQATEPVPVSAQAQEPAIHRMQVDPATLSDESRAKSEALLHQASQNIGLDNPAPTELETPTQVTVDQNPQATEQVLAPDQAVVLTPSSEVNKEHPAQPNAAASPVVAPETHPDQPQVPHPAQPSSVESHPISTPSPDQAQTPNLITDIIQVQARINELRHLQQASQLSEAQVAELNNLEIRNQELEAQVQPNQPVLPAQEEAPQSPENVSPQAAPVVEKPNTLAALGRAESLKPGDVIEVSGLHYVVPEQRGDFSSRVAFQQLQNELRLRHIEVTPDTAIVLNQAQIETAPDQAMAQSPAAVEVSQVAQPDTAATQIQLPNPAQEGVLMVDSEHQLIRATFTVGGYLDLRGFNRGEEFAVPEGQSPEKMEAVASNGDQVYRLGDTILLSDDGGQTFHQLPVTEQRVQVIGENGQVSWQVIPLDPDQVDETGRPTLATIQENTYRYARENNLPTSQFPDLDMYLPREAIESHSYNAAQGMDLLSRYARIIPGRGLVIIDRNNPGDPADITAGVSLIEYLRNSNKIAGAEADITNQGATTEVLRTLLENPEIDLDTKAQILSAILATSTDDNYTRVSRNPDLALARDVAGNLRRFGISEDGYDHMGLTAALSQLNSSQLEVNERSLRLRIVEQARELKDYSNPRFTELANLNRPLTDTEQEEFNRYVRRSRLALNPILRNIQLSPSNSSAEELEARNEYYASIRDGILTQEDKDRAMHALQTIQQQQELLGNRVEISVDEKTGIPYISRFVNSFNQELDPGRLTSEARHRVWIDPLGTALTFVPFLTGGFGGGIVIKIHDTNNFAAVAPGVPNEYIERAIARSQENSTSVTRGIGSDGIRALGIAAQVIQLTGLPFAYFAQTTTEKSGTDTTEFHQILTEGRQNLARLSETNPYMLQYAMILDAMNHPEDYSEGSEYDREHPQEAAQLRNATAQFILGDRLINDPELRAAIDEKLAAGGSPQGALNALQREGYINPLTRQPLTADDIAAATSVFAVEAQAALIRDGSRSIVPGANPTGVSLVDRVGVTFGNSSVRDLVDINQVQEQARSSVEQNIQRLDHFINDINRAVGQDGTPAVVLRNILPDRLDAASADQIVSTFQSLRNNPNAQPVTIHTNLGDVILRPGTAGNLSFSNVLGAQYVADDGTGRAGGSPSYLSDEVKMVEIEFTQRQSAEFRSAFGDYPDRVAALEHCGGNVFAANRGSLDVSIPVGRAATGLDRDTPPRNANVAAAGINVVDGSGPNDQLGALSDLQRAQGELRQISATNLFDSFRNSILGDSPLSYEEWEAEMRRINPNGFDPNSAYISLHANEAPVTLGEAYKYFEAHPDELNNIALNTDQTFLVRDMDRRATLKVSVSGNSVGTSSTHVGEWSNWVRRSTSSVAFNDDGSRDYYSRSEASRYRDTTHSESQEWNAQVQGSYESNLQAETGAGIVNVQQVTSRLEDGSYVQQKAQNSQTATLQRNTQVVAGASASASGRDSDSFRERETQQRETERRIHIPPKKPPVVPPSQNPPGSPPIETPPGGQPPVPPEGELPPGGEVPPRNDIPDEPPADDTPAIPVRPEQPSNPVNPPTRPLEPAPVEPAPNPGLPPESPNTPPLPIGSGDSIGPDGPGIINIVPGTTPNVNPSSLNPGNSISESTGIINTNVGNVGNVGNVVSPNNLPDVALPETIINDIPAGEGFGRFGL